MKQTRPPGNIKTMILMSTMLFIGIFANAQVTGGERILGRWISEKKNLIVEVDKEGAAFTAKILWFNDTDDPSHPLNERLDSKNPEESLRKRKIVGLIVLKSLTYDESTKTWENGIIYDSRSGKYWNACASLTKGGQLFVKGYWHFKFIGKTTTFSRIDVNHQ